MAIAVLSCGGFGTVAMATSITIETAADVAKMNNSNATYGTPPPAAFPDGPYTVGSGTSAPLTGGPGATKNSVDSVLLVLSGDKSALGTNSITLTFGTLSAVTIGATDFFSTAAGGFPNSIQSIANGAVNGIKFPDSDHAAVDILFSSDIAKNEALGDVTIVSPINLRVDVFGDTNNTLSGNTIAGNAANSGAEGVCGAGNTCSNTSVPEPAGITLLATGLLGLGMLQLRRRA